MGITECRSTLRPCWRIVFGLSPAYVEVKEFDCLNDEGMAYAHALQKKSSMKGRGKMNANINYIGILNMLRYLEEKGAITKAERRKIAEHIAIKTGANIVILFE